MLGFRQRFQSADLGKRTRLDPSVNLKSPPEAQSLGLAKMLSCKALLMSVHLDATVGKKKWDYNWAPLKCVQMGFFLDVFLACVLCAKCLASSPSPHDTNRAKLCISPSVCKL